jgi:hypothetical protein
MRFTTKIKIIGINPFVFVPEKILNSIFKAAEKNKGPIPIRGTINKKNFRQTLVYYSGAWRLYINTTMLKYSPKRIGEQIKINVEYDPDDRTLSLNAELKKALRKNPKAKKVFEKLTPSRRKEINRYISNLKSAESIARNVEKAIRHLKGKERFAGRG